MTGSRRRKLEIVQLEEVLAIAWNGDLQTGVPPECGARQSQLEQVPAGANQLQRRTKPALEPLGLHLTEQFLSSLGGKTHLPNLAASNGAVERHWE
jgi:hypothetical protein